MIYKISNISEQNSLFFAKADYTNNFYSFSKNMVDININSNNNPNIPAVFLGTVVYTIKIEVNNTQIGTVKSFFSDTNGKLLLSITDLLNASGVVPNSNTTEKITIGVKSLDGSTTSTETIFFSGRFVTGVGYDKITTPYDKGYRPISGISQGMNIVVPPQQKLSFANTSMGYFVVESNININILYSTDNINYVDTVFNNNNFYQIPSNATSIKFGNYISAVKQLSMCDNPIFIKWLASTGGYRSAWFRVIGNYSKITDETKLLDIGNNKSVYKTFESHLVCSIENLTAYDYWYYSDLLVSNDVSAFIINNNTSSVYFNSDFSKITVSGEREAYESGSGYVFTFDATIKNNLQ